ncbi:RNA polymerase subunit sigma, partial [Listeria monocytogenes]|nr:RNA polymerase subunit sigma [Listeria monocytogenes]
VENSIRRAKHKIDVQKEKSLLVNVYLNGENEVHK